MTWKFSRLLRPFLQVGFFWIALGTSVSRISDYKHHWSDVLAGALLGIIVAVLTVCTAVYFFVFENEINASHKWLSVIYVCMIPVSEGTRCSLSICITAQIDDNSASRSTLSLRPSYILHIPSVLSSSLQYITKYLGDLQC